MTPPAEPIRLSIDASTYTGSAAVLRGNTLLTERTAPMRGATSEHLTPTVAGALRDAGVQPGELAEVVCGAGPGSFTSLRIAGSVAKGIAFARSIPLRAVSSLVLMVAALDPLPAAGRYLALLDALRGEAYAQLVEIGGSDAGDARVFPAGDPVRVAEADVASLADSLGATTVGHGRAIDAAPRARGVARLGALLATSGVVDLASWEPNYGRLAEAQVKWEAAHGRPLPQR